MQWCTWKYIYINSSFVIHCSHLCVLLHTNAMLWEFVYHSRWWLLNASLQQKKCKVVDSNIIGIGVCTLHCILFVLFKIPRNLRANKRDSIRAKLNVFGGPVHGGLVIQKSEIITIKIPKISVFIQTDKPIYKPGQTGNFTKFLLRDWPVHREILRKRQNLHQKGINPLNLQKWLRSDFPSLLKYVILQTCKENRQAYVCSFINEVLFNSLNPKSAQHLISPFKQNLLFST